MIKETVCINEKKTSLSVTNSKISAVLRSNIQKTGVRLYEKDCIGIAGAIGSYDDNDLTNNAKQMLKFKVPYECAPTEEEKRSLIRPARTVGGTYYAWDGRSLGKWGEPMKKIKS